MAIYRLQQRQSTTKLLAKFDKLQSPNHCHNIDASSVNDASIDTQDWAFVEDSEEFYPSSTSSSSREQLRVPESVSGSKRGSTRCRRKESTFARSSPSIRVLPRELPCKEEKQQQTILLPLSPSIRALPREVIMSREDAECCDAKPVLVPLSPAIKALSRKVTSSDKGQYEPKRGILPMSSSMKSLPREILLVEEERLQAAKPCRLHPTSFSLRALPREIEFMEREIDQVKRETPLALVSSRRGKVGRTERCHSALARKSSVHPNNVATSNKIVSRRISCQLF